MKKFTLAGKEIVAKDFDFNMICDITDENIDINKMRKAPHSFIRFYVAYCLGVPKDVAGTLINTHLKDGGDLTEVLTVIAEKMNESEFFRGE